MHVQLAVPVVRFDCDHPNPPFSEVQHLERTRCFDEPSDIFSNDLLRADAVIDG